jgi:spore coat-associated protein N
MTIKKKLGVGMASAVLGLSLIGGGTFAAFNDTATVNNHFASGTLKLSVGSNEGNKPNHFDISNMKPGDSVQRKYRLENAGTILIENIFMTVKAKEYSNNDSGATIEEFLNQFEITLYNVYSNNDGEYNDKNSLIKENTSVTLKDLVKGDLSGKIKGRYMTEGKVNLAPIGISNNSRNSSTLKGNSLVIMIKFKEDNSKDDNGQFYQNKFMNNTVNFDINFEATQ